eukprot:TRINITY_DN4416_c0_g1_i1.p1 TRINITY_DN4416_c0_g1~~TRINITY_DN4416_c0_g1_i1.p1  ORF type:complete len:369 (+),score=93.64 TRINITY_DN4416_c0_g1_i1:84-1190(+)
MKITLKTMQRESYDMEVEGSLVIADLKTRVESQFLLGTAANMKLIYQGKVLGDSDTLDGAQVKEGSFIVVMVTKAKPTTTPATPSESAVPATPAPKAVPSTPAAPAAPVAQRTLIPETPQPRPQTAPVQPLTPVVPPAASQETPVVAQANPSAAQEAIIARIMELGFERDQTIRALRASFGNPDRAVEYLMTGIPEIDETPAAIPPRRAATQAQSGLAASAGETPSIAPVLPFGNAQMAGQDQENANSGALEFLRHDPVFHQIRQAVQRNPQVLPSILQLIATQYPTLFQQINQHQQEFMDMLEEEGEDEEDIFAGIEDSLQLTQEDRQAVERLCAMGYDRTQVIQVYVACDKNEEVALAILSSDNDD